MNVIEGELTPAAHAYALIGNGRRDIRILKAIAEKYDHSKTLRAPQPPISPGTGLTIVARSLAKLMDQVAVSRYLIIIDREHAKSLQEAEEKLREHGVNITSAEKLTEGSWLLKAKRDSRKAEVYLAVMGEHKSIEENIAKLIELTYSERVKADKSEIRSWLRRHSLRDIDLVKEAGKQEVEAAFPALTRALKKIASDP